MQHHEFFFYILLFSLGSSLISCRAIIAEILLLRSIPETKSDFIEILPQVFIYVVATNKQQAPVKIVFFIFNIYVFEDRPILYIFWPHPNAIRDLLGKAGPLGPLCPFWPRWKKLTTKGPFRLRKSPFLL